MSMTELDQRRALEEAREAEGIPRNGAVEGRSFADRAAEAEAEPWNESQEEQEELFVIEQGRRVTLSQLIAKKTPIEYSVNLSSKSFKGGDSMGLLPFSDAEMILVVPVRQGKVIADPTYSEDGYVAKVSIRAYLKPLTAHDVKSTEGQALLGLEE